jgi:hypothetical protein
MAETSDSLADLPLSGRVYLVHEMPEAPINGDLRLRHDPNHNAGYIKLEVFSGQWHYVASWHYHKEFRYFMVNWSDPWLLAKIFQRLLQALRPHLELGFRNQRNGLCIREASKAVAQPWLEAALAEANQLLAAHEPEL